MLRVILGLAGVALISLGVFGGRSLEFVHAKVSGILAPQDSAQPVLADSESSLQLVPDEAVDLTEVVAAQTLPAVKVAQPVEQASLLTDVSETDVSEAGVEPTAAVATMAEVPASARNKEVAVARALLNGGPVKQGENPLKTAALSKPDKTAVVDKNEAVEQVVQATTDASENKSLTVLKDSVNLREGPSTNHSVVLELARGQELMEFKRDGKWVHVGAYGTDGKIGWVHGTLVGAN